MVAGKIGELQSRMRGNAKQLCLLAITVLAFNLLFWQVIHPTIFAAPKGLDLVKLENFHIAQIDTPSKEAFDLAEFKSDETSFSACCAPQYHAAKFDLNLEEIPETGLGFIKVMQVDNYRLYVNDALIVSKGKMLFGEQTFHGQRTYLEHIPAHILRVGLNEVQLITVRNSTPYTDIRNPVIGEYESLRLATAQRLWVMNGYKQTIMVVCLLIGIVCAVISFRSRYRLFLFWFAVLSLIWAANLGRHFIMDWPLGGKARYLYYVWVNIFMPVVLYNLLDSWTGRPRLKIQMGLCVFAALLSSYLCYQYLYTGFPDGFEIGDKLISWTFLLVSVAAIIRVIWHFVHRNDKRFFEIAALSLIGVSVILDAWSEIIHHQPGGYTPAVAPIFLLTLILAFLNRNFHLFRSTQQINSFLGEELKQREQDLAEAYESRKQFIRKQAHAEERQRLMRDMHDGLGSQLMSMLLSAKRGRSKPQAVAEGLQSVIDEMRLMIDSMDSVGESVDVAFKTFKDRAHQRVTDAGMEFIWQDESTTTLMDYSARDILQIFRILQEATTNSIRHSGGKTITIRIQDHTIEPAGIALSILDDGHGLTKQNKLGRGLENMKTRAAQIGASLDLNDIESGFEVAVVLPAHRNKDVGENG